VITSSIAATEMSKTLKLNDSPPAQVKASLSARDQYTGKVVKRQRQGESAAERDVGSKAEEEDDEDSTSGEILGDG
jgi:hypothetical protein